MSLFKIGEIAIIQSIDHPEFNGLETEIIKPITVNGDPAYVCTVRVLKGIGGWYETALRKLPPPNTKTSWEDSTIFRPEKEHA